MEMDAHMVSCAFTGHRPHKLSFGHDENHPHCIHIKEQMRRCLIRLMEGYGVTRIYSGMAQGADTWGLEIALGLKDSYGLYLVAIIPYRAQADNWQPSERQRYAKLLEQCDKVHCVSEVYTKSCMQERNRQLVHCADYILGVYAPTIGGGTGQTLRYAKAQGKRMIIINPNSGKIRAENFIEARGAR